LHVQNVIEKLIVADHKQAAERAAELGVLPNEW
jgi:ATP/maltotriose-dependent transcriptional regulator MalT